jgi:hypothetical protein
MHLSSEHCEQNAFKLLLAGGDIQFTWQILFNLAIQNYRDFLLQRAIQNYRDFFISSGNETKEASTPNQHLKKQ